MRRTRHLLELGIIIAMVAVAVAVYRNSQPPPTDELPELGEALRLYKIGHYHQAIPFFTEVLRRQPQVLQARTYRALCYVNTKQLKEARADFEEGKAGEPMLVQYLYPRLSLVLQRESARLFIMEGQYDSAKVDALKAVERADWLQVHSGWPFPEEMLEAHHVLGLAHAGKQEYLEARSELMMATWFLPEQKTRLAQRHVAAVELLSDDEDAAVDAYRRSEGARDDDCFLCRALRPHEASLKKKAK